MSVRMHFYFEIAFRSLIVLLQAFLAIALQLSSLVGSCTK